MRTFILAPLLLSLSLSAATFMKGDFERIVRLDAINMTSDDNSSNEIVAETLKKVREFESDGLLVKITIVGHTNRATDDANEKSIDSDTYANKIQNWFRYSLDTKSAQNLSKDYAQEIKDKMLDANLSKDILFTEYRGGLDQAFSDATTEGRDLSNRVMVSIYVYEATNVNQDSNDDNDADGIFDKRDKCPDSPSGYAVDSDGCSVDSDEDGVLDYEDECPKTPKNIIVDEKGCSLEGSQLDRDKDGVSDYKDLCLYTPLGLNVDQNGCSLKAKLHLNFKPSSDELLQGSYSDIKRFAKFMKENPLYSVEIIGHTDSSGKAVDNMQLSQKRAEVAKNALIAEGIEAARLKASGRGGFDPVETNRTAEGRKANNRIEVQFSVLR